MDKIVERITELLKQKAGYVPVAAPLRVKDVDFKFDQVLLGPNQQNGLVIILGSSSAPSELALHRAKLLVQLLDRNGSKRTVTLVCVIRTSSTPDFSELEEISHVIALRPEIPLERGLRTLLPLVLPEEQRELPRADEALKKELDDVSDPFISKLLIAAYNGRDEIKYIIAREIEGCLGDDILQMDEDD